MLPSTLTTWDEHLEVDDERRTGLDADDEQYRGPQHATSDNSAGTPVELFRPQAQGWTSPR